MEIYLINNRRVVYEPEEESGYDLDLGKIVSIEEIKEHGVPFDIVADS